MYQIFKQRSPLTFVLLIILILVLNIKSFLIASLPQTSSSTFVFNSIVKLLSFLLSNYSMLWVLLSALLLSIQAFWLNRVLIKHHLVENNEYFTTYSFIVLSSLLHSSSMFSSFLLTNFIVIYILDLLFTTRNQEQSHKQIYQIGISYSIALLLDFNIIIFLPFLIATILLLRPFKIKEWVILVLGLILPIYILFSFLFITNQLELIKPWFVIQSKFHHQDLFSGRFWFVTLSCLSWCALALFSLYRLLITAPVTLRRYWSVINISILGFFFVFSFNTLPLPISFVILVPMLSILFQNAFTNARFNKINIIGFYFTLSLALFCQII